MRACSYSPEEMEHINIFPSAERTVKLVFLAHELTTIFIFLFFYSFFFFLNEPVFVAVVVVVVGGGGGGGGGGGLLLLFVLFLFTLNIFSRLKNDFMAMKRFVNRNRGGGGGGQRRNNKLQSVLTLRQRCKQRRNNSHILSSLAQIPLPLGYRCWFWFYV